MKLGKLSELIPVNNDTVEVNPTEMLEDHFSHQRGNKDYRKQAIDFSIKHRLPIKATSNNVFTLAQQFISITCPCGEDMKHNGGGGGSEATSVGYDCPKCKAHAYITISNHGGFGISFPEARP